MCLLGNCFSAACPRFLLVTRSPTYRSTVQTIDSHQQPSVFTSSISLSPRPQLRADRDRCVMSCFVITAGSIAHFSHVNGSAVPRVTFELVTWVDEGLFAQTELGR